MSQLSHWHPVLAAQALGMAPVAVRVLATDLVLWRDATGTARAFDDRCPHRGTRLSLGRVQEGRLECPYHGWQFDGAGRCMHVPAEPAFQPSASQSACNRSLQEEHAMLWVRLDDAPGAAARPPEVGQPPSRRLVCGPYDVHTSAPRVVENFLDTAHFPFVHAHSLGDRAHAQVPPYAVQTDPQGRPGVASYRAWQPQSSAAAAQGGWVHYRYQVLGPYSALLEKKPAAGMLREVYALWVCPVEAQASRVWFTLWTSDDSQSDDALRNFQNAVFLQDRAVLESQQPRELPLDSREAPGPADRLSAAYRRYLRRQGITFGVCG